LGRLLGTSASPLRGDGVGHGGGPGEGEKPAIVRLDRCTKLWHTVAPRKEGIRPFSPLRIPFGAVQVMHLVTYTQKGDDVGFRHCEEYVLEPLEPPGLVT